MESTRAILRFAGVALVAILLVIGGVAMRANFWPRVVRVEQRVVAPAVDAFRPQRAPVALADMIAAACPAIVAIQAGPTNESAGTMAGFLVSADGYVVTAQQTLPADGAVRVMLNDGRTLEGARVGGDPVSGLALLKLAGTDFPVLQFADAGLPRVGDAAVALAAPNATGCIAEPGIIAGDFVADGAGQRSYVRLRPAPDAAFAGAPVLNADGRVIGVAGLGAPDDPDLAARLLPAALSNQVVSDLIRSGTAGTGAFGIVAEDLNPTLAGRIGVDRDRGAMVSLIRAHSPADRAGLKAGDVIFAVADAPIAGASELARALDTSDPVVTLDVMRRAERLRVTLRKS